MRALSKQAAVSKKAYHHGNLRAVLIEAALHFIQGNGVRALMPFALGSAPAHFIVSCSNLLLAGMTQ